MQDQYDFEESEEDRIQYQKLDEEMVTLISRLVKLEKKAKQLSKATGLGKGADQLDETAVAFSANMTPQSYVPPGDKVVCDEVLLNTGRGYDKTTGVFKATIPGRYIFSLTVRADYHKQVCAEILNKCAALNRYQTIGKVSCGYAAIERASGAITVVTMMQKGDEVYVKQSEEKGGEYYGNACTAFSGILLPD